MLNVREACKTIVKQPLLVIKLCKLKIKTIILKTEVITSRIDQEIFKTVQYKLFQAKSSLKFYCVCFYYIDKNTISTLLWMHSLTRVINCKK